MRINISTKRNPTVFLQPLDATENSINEVRALDLRSYEFRRDPENFMQKISY